MLSWLFSDPLAVGTPAPDFTLLDEAGRSVTLSKLRGKNVVLVFYPGDDTPGCNKQLCDFRDHWKEARERGTVVFGVNPQSAGSHTKFRQKFQFPFPLLVDPGQHVASLYHANGLIIKRTVYRIDTKGVIRFAQRGAPAAAAVLAE
jgi:peroxiredoxin Q/BCP